MKIKNLTAVAAMTVIICVCSWIAIPVTVPFTMQTFGVFAALFLLGGKLGTVSVALYILMGAVGLPVFSGFQCGLGHLLGPTGGYILGFLTHSLIYWLGEKHVSGCGRYALQLLGLLSCYVFGTAWYTAVAGSGKGFWAAAAICVVPYIVPDILKLYLAAFVTNRIKKHIYV